LAALLTPPVSAAEAPRLVTQDLPAEPAMLEVKMRRPK